MKKTCLVETQSNTIDELQGKIKKLELEQEQEQEELKLLIERAFARRSERYLNDPNQLQIDFGDDAADAAEGLAEAIDEAGIKEPEQETVIGEHVRREPRASMRVQSAGPRKRARRPATMT